jgi:hypothetical protein
MLIKKIFFYIKISLYIIKFNKVLWKKKILNKFLYKKIKLYLLNIYKNSYKKIIFRNKII